MNKHASNVLIATTVFCAILALSVPARVIMTGHVATDQESTAALALAFAAFVAAAFGANLRDIS